MDSELEQRVSDVIATTEKRSEKTVSTSQAVVVLGMHRSGTSAMMRVLNLLGIEIGTGLMAATGDNAKGYFELSRVRDIDDTMLESLGSSWHDVNPLPHLWWEDEKVVRHVDQLVEVLQAQVRTNTRWGIKDPRICRLLPVWKQVFKRLDSMPHYIIITRHPLEVMQSLIKRDGISENHALLLWLRYVLDAELHSRNARRVFVTYDDLMSNWSQLVDNIQKGLQWSFLPDQDSVRSAINDFLCPRLRHHSADQSVSPARHLLLPWAEEVYSTLCATSGHDVIDYEFFDRIARELDELSILFNSSRVAAKSPATDEKAPDKEESYRLWMDRKALTESDGQYMAERMMQRWHHRPGIHIIMPLFPGSERYLADTLDSLSRQLYSEWGLTVVANVPAPDRAFHEQPMLEWIETSDAVAVAANRIIKRSPADWIALLMPGVQFAQQALFSIADYANLNGDWRVIYSDEDRIGSSGQRCEPSFKPDINLDLLRSAAYVGEAVFFRKDTVLDLGGFADYRAHENYDLLFRLIERCGCGSVGHIADVLIHVPQFAMTEEEISFLDRQGRQIVDAHVRRSGDVAEVLGGLLPQSYRLVYSQDEQPLVSIIIPSKDRLDLLEPCVESLIDKTGYPNYEIMIVDNGSTAIDTHDYYDELQSRYPEKIRIFSCPGEFNYSAMNNLAVQSAKGDYLVLLNNDTQIVQGEWLERMMVHAQRPEVGIVGPRLIYPNCTLQHAGVILGMAEVADHIGNGQGLHEPGHLNRYQLDQQLSAVTGACMLVRKSVYQEVHGLDEEELKVCYNDIDFCLKVTEKGYKIIWTPYATLVHHGSATQWANVAPEKLARFRNEQDVMRHRWLKQLAHDPAYNPNLSLYYIDGRAESQVLPRWDVHFRDRPRIVGYPLDYFGCGQYRIIAPLTALDRAAVAQCALMPRLEMPGKVVRITSSVEIERMAPDVMCLQSPLSDESLQALAIYKRHNKAFRVFELDDLKSNVPGKNSRRKYLFRDMKDRLRKALAMCDRLIVSTEPLVEATRCYIDDIRIVPNYLEASRWDDLRSQRRCGRLPRVGWAGAQQHHGDLEFLIDVVKATAKEVEWVLFGMCLDELRPYVTEVHEFVDFDSYPGKLASLNLDLAVAPLEYHPFNEAKSNLRLLEYGVLGWPVVCTDIFPYQNAPVKQLANDSQAWIDAIRERVHDLDAAAREGDRLQAWVRGNWILEDHLNEWLAALSPGEIVGRSDADVRQYATG